MGRHIRWQAILALTGIVLTLAILGSLSFSRTTVVVEDNQTPYREAVVGKPQLINPLFAQYNQVDQDAVGLLFNGLTRDDGQGNLVPDLATDWQVSPNQLVYLFKLRRDVQWHDGEPFTAKDVVFTIGLMQDAEYQGPPTLKQLWQTVAVQKLGSDMVRFTLSEPLPTFLNFTTIGMLPAHILEDVPAKDLITHPFNVSPIGTGPFKFDTISDEFIRFSPNQDYFESQPQLEVVELWFYTSHQEAISAYETDEVNAISNIAPQIIPQAQSVESLNLYTTRLSGYTLVYLNLRNTETLPFFQEKSVRQALLIALNRQAIINTELNGQGVVASGPIHPWSWAFNPDYPADEFDPLKANAMLDEAGWIDSDGDNIREKNGQQLAFNLLVHDTSDRIALAQALTEHWRQIGIGVNIELVEGNLGSRLTQGDYHAVIADIRLSGDPDPYPLWHQSQIDVGQNYAGWSHDRASELLVEARSLTDTGPRNDLYYEFQEIFAEEVPSLILYYPVYTYGLSQDVLNVQLGPLAQPSDRFRTITDWTILTRRVVYSETQFVD